MENMKVNKNPLRLEISNTEGYSCLHFQFNITEEEKRADREACQLLAIMMKYYLSETYQAKGLNDPNISDGSFYCVDLTDNYKGFCISIKWGSVHSEQEALDIVESALDYVSGYDDTDEETVTLIRSNIGRTKELAETLRKEIFDDRSFSFSNKYSDPFA